jgi:16S rRNA processing protein RimM
MRERLLTSGWLPLVHLLRPQGRRGELLAELLTDLPGLFTAGRVAVLAPSGATKAPPGAHPRRIEDHFFPTGKNAGRIVLKLSGCNSISEAEALAGNDLLIAAKDLPPLEEDTFFVGDLVGCTLYDSAKPGGPVAVGTVIDLEFVTAPDGRTRLEDAAPLLAIAPLGGSVEVGADPILVPFVRSWLEAVDIPGRRIIMRLAEGLFDFESPVDPSP